MPTTRILLLLFLWLCQVHGSTLTADVAFQTSGQSMWGPGAAQTFDYSRTLFNQNFDVSGHVGGVSKNFFGRFGAELGAHVSGNVGLGFESHFTTGDVSVNVPVHYSLTLPDSNTISPGGTFQISSSYDLLGGDIETRSPQGGWGVYLNANVNAGINGRACVFGCVSGSASKDFSVHQRLLGVDQNSHDLSFTGPAGIHAGLGFPVVNTSGALNGGHIASGGSAQFASVGWNFTDFIQQLTGVPIKGNLDIGIAKVAYKLLDIDLGAALRAAQQFDFTPIPMIDLAISGQHLIFAAGSTIEFTMPESGLPLEFTPSYFLANTFSSRTDLALSAYLDLAALQASARLLRWNVGIGPLFHKRWDLSLGQWTVQNWTGELQGFNTVLGETTSVTPTPEPATYLFVGSALIALGVLRRRRFTGH